MPKYRNKLDSLRSAVKVWACTSCGNRFEKLKPSDCCQQCGGNNWHYFASKFEARRFSDLMMLQKTGLISDLKTQVKYNLEINDSIVCAYVADFVYTDVGAGKTVVEDTKGSPRSVTDVFKLKAMIMKASLGIDINVVYQSDSKKRK